MQLLMETWTQLIKKKKVIEAEQRLRESQKLKDGLKYDGLFFMRPTEGEEDIDICDKWVFKDNIVVDENYINEANKKAEEIRALKQNEPESEPVKTEEPKQEQCAIQ